jgi:ribonuclease HI
VALDALPCDDISVWSDSSAFNGVTNGGSGAPIVSKGEEKIRVAAGSLTSSYRAELVAFRAALERALLLEGTVALFTVSLSLLQVC